MEFLIQEAFGPVLKARPDGCSDADRKKLERVQNATRAEIERFRGYGSAGEAVVNFKRDLSSRTARKTHSELKALDLPTTDGLREEFEREASELGEKA